MGTCKIHKPTGAGLTKHGDTLIKIIHNGEVSEPVKYEGEKGDLTLELVCEESTKKDFYVIGSGKLSSDRLVVNSSHVGTTIDLRYKDKSVLDNFDATIEDLQNQITTINKSGVDTSEADNYITFHPIE